MKANMTKHAKIDRYDRICAIVDLFNGDIGETVIRVWSKKYNSFQELTSNGVVISRSANDMIITMFLCNMDKARYFCASSGKELTKNQWKRIKENQKYITLIQ